MSNDADLLRQVIALSISPNEFLAQLRSAVRVTRASGIRTARLLRRLRSPVQLLAAEDVAAALKLAIAGDVDAELLTEWAFLMRALDDYVEYEAQIDGNSTIADVMHALVVPELEGELTKERLRYLLDCVESGVAP